MSPFEKVRGHTKKPETRNQKLEARSHNKWKGGYIMNTEVSYINGEVPVKGLNFIQRVAGIIHSPGKVMENLSAKPRVIFPLIMIAIAQLAFYLLRFDLYKDFLRQSALASSGFAESLTGVKLTPEMIEKTLPQSIISSFITTPLGTLFMWLLTTVILFAIFKIAGGQGKFKAYLSVTGYAYVISALYLVITAVVSFFTNNLHLMIPLTSLANVFPAEMKGNFLFGMIKGIDLFSIWYYCVIAIGMTAVTGFKKRTVYSIIAGVFVIGLLIAGAGEIAVGKMF
jgi:hypothetical protein